MFDHKFFVCLYAVPLGPELSDPPKDVPGLPRTPLSLGDPGGKFMGP